MEIVNEMGTGISLCEAEGEDGINEFMLDVSDLLTNNNNNNNDMPSHENIQSYFTSQESVELPPFPGSNLPQENEISSNHHDDYNNYQGLENVQLDQNNLNSVQPVETSSLNPHSDDALPPPNMSQSQSRRSTTQEIESRSQGCASIYALDDQSQQSTIGDKVGVMNGISSMMNQPDFNWVPQNQNYPYRPSSQSRPPSSIQGQEHDQVRVPPTVNIVASPPCFSAPFQMRLTFGPQMQTSPNVFYPPRSHNTIPYDQPSLVSKSPQEAAQFQGLANQTAGFNNLNPNEGGAHQQVVQIVVTMPQEVHLQVLQNESAGRPGFSALNERPSNQIQIFVSGQPHGLIPTQTAPPNPNVHNPIQQNQDQGLNIEVSVPRLLEESSRPQNQFRRLAQHAHARPQMELGESSTRAKKRMARRDHQVQSGLNPQPVISNIFKPQGTETQDKKRRALNHLYDPLYEDTGLPIDPHLRRFLPQKKEKK